MDKLTIILLITVTVVFSFVSPIASTQTVRSTSQTSLQSSQSDSTVQDDVIRVSTELVQTDVTVLDKQGRFVEGLDRDSFELQVDGKPQPIIFFERVTAGTNKDSALSTSARNGPKPSSEGAKSTSPAESPTISDRGRTTFFFVDDLHLSPSSMNRTRSLLLNYVEKTMRSEDQAAIVTASGQLGFLQQLTGYRDMLRKAIDRLSYRPFSSGDTVTSPAMNEYQAVAVENGDREAFSYLVDQQCEEFKRMGRGACAVGTNLTNNAIYDDAVARSGRGGTTSGTSPGPVPTDPGQTVRGRANSASGNTLRQEAERQVRSRARIIARQAAQVTLNTLGSLEKLIQSSSLLPERKLVVFISDGFFINYLRSTNAYDLRRISDTALRSGSVIYTIDARGLVAGSMDASSKDGFDPQGRATRLTINEVTAAQDPLHALAADTGGRAWINSNDLAQGLTAALQETSAYYLLAWRPDRTEFSKDNFRRLEVKVKGRQDLTVRVHSGFFARDPRVVLNTSGASNVAGGVSVDDQLIGAIRAFYPSRGIPIVLSLGYLDEEKDGLVLAASAQVELAPGSAADGKDIGDIGLDLIGAVVDQDGKILSSLKQKVTIPADQTIAANSVVVTLQFPNLGPGLRQVRIAARDSKSGRLGSASQWIEIPSLIPGEFSLSSIFLSEAEVSKSALQKVAIKPDARFQKTARLRFQIYVYNARRLEAAPNVVMQLDLRRDGQTVIQTPPNDVQTAGVKDLARIPVVGEFPLESFPAGRYELNLVLTDLSTKKSASQLVYFIIQQ